MVDTLFGGPGETRQRVEQAIATLKESRADCIGLSCGVRIYPNTPLAETVMDQGPLDQNPHLHGVTGGNDSLLRPIFYVDAGLGDDLYAIVSRSVDGDPRFFHTDPDDADGNYNYNDNSVLAEAIRAGARGAYWSILHDLASG